MVWGRELRPGDRSVDVYVSKLRAKLEQAVPGQALHPHPPELRLPLPARGALAHELAEPTAEAAEAEPPACGAPAHGAGSATAAAANAIAW